MWGFSKVKTTTVDIMVTEKKVYLLILTTFTLVWNDDATKPIRKVAVYLPLNLWIEPLDVHGFFKSDKGAAVLLIFKSNAMKSTRTG